MFQSGSVAYYDGGMPFGYGRVVPHDYDEDQYDEYLDEYDPREDWQPI